MMLMLLYHCILRFFKSWRHLKVLMDQISMNFQETSQRSNYLGLHGRVAEAFSCSFGDIIVHFHCLKVVDALLDEIYFIVLVQFDIVLSFLSIQN
ncbi:hypothetical protein NC653_038137 [Populus alba x Populus x berolinensis]|nr:hypothetical protein NC653_038137 [Populus alba x Populus x berolinensis]